MNVKEILDSHKKWIKDKKGGERANLEGADLRGADLEEAYLGGADLRGAKNIYAFGPMPTSGRICIAICH